MAITVIPKDTSFTNLLASVLMQQQQAAQQEELERRRLAAEESRFTRSAEALQPLTDAQIAAAKAEREQRNADALNKVWITASEQAKLTFAPIQRMLDDAKAAGGPEVQERVKNIASQVYAQYKADPEIMRLASAYIHLSPAVLPTDITQGNITEANRRATGNILDKNGGITGGTFADQNRAMKLGTGEQISQAGADNYQAREFGPKAVRSQVDIATKVAPEANTRLITATQKETEAMGNASAERIAALNRESMERAASIKADARGSASGDDEYKQDRRQRIITSVDGLMKRVGYNTVGIGSWLANIPNTEAADFEADLDTLAGNIAFNELKEMRDASKTGGALGSIAVRELELLQSTLGGLKTKQSPENFKKNLNRVRDDVMAGIERWERAKSGGGYKHTATNPATGARIGSNDGVKWEPID